MKLTEKQKELLDKSTGNYIDYLECDKDSHLDNNAASFALGAIIAIGCAKTALCIDCPNNDGQNECKLEKCPVDEWYMTVVLKVLLNTTAKMLEDVRKKRLSYDYG